MVREDFIQSSTTVRVYETKLLSRPTTERIIDAKDFDDAFKMLSETVYGDKLQKLEKKEDYGDALQAELEEVYRKIREMNQGEVIYDFASLRYSFHNLKVLIKENILKKDFSEILSALGNVNIPVIRAELGKERGKDLTVRYMSQVAQVLKDYEEHQDPQRIDILLDKFYLAELIRVAEESKIEMFQDYAADTVDVSNVKSLIRSKKQGKSPDFVKFVLADGGRVSREQMLSMYGENVGMMLEKLTHSVLSSHVRKGLDAYKASGRLQEIERELENYQMERAKKSKSVTYGPEVLFSYLLAKEAEVKNLRILMVSKQNGLSAEAIRERLRDSYV